MPLVSSEVYGSYSVGGTITMPPVPRIPMRTPSRSAVKNDPMTGPVEREYGYSSTCGLVKTCVGSATFPLHLRRQRRFAST